MFYWFFPSWFSDCVCWWRQSILVVSMLFTKFQYFYCFSFLLSFISHSKAKNQFQFSCCFTCVSIIHFVLHIIQFIVLFCFCCRRRFAEIVALIVIENFFLSIVDFFSLIFWSEWEIAPTTIALVSTTQLAMMAFNFTRFFLLHTRSHTHTSVFACAHMYACVCVQTVYVMSLVFVCGFGVRFQSVVCYCWWFLSSQSRTQKERESEKERGAHVSMWIFIRIVPPW